MHIRLKSVQPVVLVLATLCVAELLANNVEAQAQSTEPPQAAAPIDLTGTWVSVVTEEWRWRMVTAPRGDFSSLPLNDEARRVGEAWDPIADERVGEACRAYGAAGIMRMPTRINISWQDDTTLRLETDAGKQTRLFHFGESMAPAAERGWQGDSQAAWQFSPNADPAVRPQPGAGSLTVTTTNMRPGYLLKNGVPYSGDGILTEHFHRHNSPNGDVWFTVVVILEDPTYLTERYVSSYHFKKEADTSGWNPTPCIAG